MAELIQCKSHFTIRGLVVGLTNPGKNGGLKEGKTEKGVEYKSVRLGVKTSKDNTVFCEIFGMKKTDAFFYDRKEKKTHKVAWDKRHVKPKNENIQLIKPEWDIVEEIVKEYKDGDAVVINGSIDFSIYIDQQGQEKQQQRFTIKSIYKATNPIDLEASDYEEQNQFIQEVVIADITEDAKTKRVFITTNVINYGNKIAPAQFIVNTETANPTFVKNLKGLKFGDFLKINGVINSRAVTQEVDNGWGKQVVTGINKSLEVLGADPSSLVKKRYSETDLFAGQSQQQQPPKDVKFEEKDDNDFGRQVDDNSDEDLPFDL